MADEANAVSDAVDAAASKLADQDREGLARYAREMSSKLGEAARQIEGRSVDELAADAKRPARSNPALFTLGSVAVGFGLSRFFKASAEHGNNDDAQHARDSLAQFYREQPLIAGSRGIAIGAVLGALVPPSLGVSTTPGEVDRKGHGIDV